VAARRWEAERQRRAAADAAAAAAAAASKAAIVEAAEQRRCEEAAAVERANARRQQSKDLEARALELRQVRIIEVRCSKMLQAPCVQRHVRTALGAVWCAYASWAGSRATTWRRALDLRQVRIKELGHISMIGLFRL